MNKRTYGQQYEEMAAAYIAGEGIKIIGRNVHMGRIGEIDIIGIDQSSSFGETLVFFEVKYRKDDRFGTAVEAVDLKKQQTIKKCASYYLAYRNIKSFIRFDVIAIDGEKINWIKNAF